ncbi:hypothetical protein [Acetivibrio cellulolyticus]|uniref:hypothetical protein n=1 Tax=Acetivibrio cellulolyticus TaxID=35830 RepID=UPI0001E2E7D9|nr:hypothetical protein [Acetivibrio cellulolyticus]
MSFLSTIFIFVILIWVFIRTLSYGKWTWDKKNRLGAIMILVVALAELILPIYSLYFRE